MTTDLQKTDSQSQAVAIPEDVSVAALEMAVGMGDFSKLTAADRLRYLASVCRSIKLNPLTLPFRIIKMDGRDVLYATADCSAQLRARDTVSIEIVSKSVESDCYVVIVRGTLPNGKKDEATGAVPLVYPEKVREWIGGNAVWKAHPKAGQKMTGLDWANAVKKAETQAKRRVTLSICGLGIPDESEFKETVDVNTTVASVERALNSAEMADRLNEEVQSEAAKTVEAEVVKEPVQTANEDGQPTAAESEFDTAETPAAPVTPPANTAPVETEAEKMARELETLFAENKDCVPFCIAKGKLAKGKGLADLDKAFADKIFRNPKGFFGAVENWVKGGKK